MSAKEPEQQTRELLRVIAEAGIEHVVVGGVAAIAWGGSEFTQDLDIVIPFDADRDAKLMKALAPHRPRHWTRPDLGEITEPAEYLDDLIAIKEHVRRPKDVVTAAQLRAIRTRLPK